METTSPTTTAPSINPTTTTITIQLAERDGSYVRRAEIPAPGARELMPDIVIIDDHGDDNRDSSSAITVSAFINANIVTGVVRVVARADQSPELAVYRRATMARAIE